MVLDVVLFDVVLFDVFTVVAVVLISSSSFVCSWDRSTWPSSAETFGSATPAFSSASLASLTLPSRSAARASPCPDQGAEQSQAFLGRRSGVGVVGDQHLAGFG